MPDMIVDVRSLVVDFPIEGGWLRAVDGISFGVRAGETLAIVGESGSGKSVTMSAIMGRAVADGARVQGSVLIEGQEILRAPESVLQQVRGRKVALIPQDPGGSLNPVRTVGAQMREMLTFHRKLSAREADAAAMQSLDEVAIPDPARQLRAYPFELSGGMLQRVLIATALALHPQVVIADEATTALDVSVQAQILNLMQTRIKEAGMTLIIISHDLSVVSGLADRIAVMYAGQIAELSGVDELFTSPQHPYTEALLGCIPRLRAEGPRQVLVGIPGHPPDPRSRREGCAFAPRCAYARPVCSERRPALTENAEHRLRACWVSDEGPLSSFHSSRRAVALEAEAEEAAELERTADGAAQPVLRAEDLRVSYRKPSLLSWGRGAELTAVEEVSIEVGQGETLGIVGESGCGKSSLGRAVLRLTRASAGSVQFFGEEVLRMPGPRLRLVRPKMQLVLQSSRQAFDPRMSVYQSMLEAIGVVERDRSVRDRRVYELLDVVELPPRVAEAFPQELSGGQQQRVNIARALATRPSLIVADEPTAALDVSVRAQILQLLRRIQREERIAYLFISHDLTVISQMAERVAVIYLGRVIETGETTRVLGQPRHPYTRALMQAIPASDPIVARERGLHPIGGEPPNPADRPGGCYFHPRCPFATDLCRQERPELRVLEAGHLAACHYAETLGEWPGAERAAGGAGSAAAGRSPDQA
jgi:peptide/nickel transport system ATP-binding protein